FILRRVWIILYNLFGHPLRNVPSPKLYAVSQIPQTWRGNILGHHYSDLTNLHEKYGDVVRVGPNEISCVSPESWKIIHGNGEYFLRDPHLTALLPVASDSLCSPNRKNHRLFHHLIRPVFSDKALAAQSPEIIKFADKMIAALKDRSSKPINIALVVEWAAVDVMGFLRLLHAGVEALPIGQIILRFKLLAFFYAQVTRLPVVQRWMQAFRLAEDSTRARIEAGASGKKDAVTMMWEENKLNGTSGINISQSSIEDVSALLFWAGSETTATALGGIIWLLLSNPRAYKKFTAEIRSLSEVDLTPRTLGSLVYLNCTIQEGLRLHSPLVIPIQRIVPKGGTTIDGYFVPERTKCGIPHYATANLPRHFHEVTEFYTERWLPEKDSRFADDRRESFQPFARGGMSCVGKQ
ncbi:MAG: hypothetical protein Q9186_000620, partial [Xanthomendoza sp. 1 TL-2023]